MAVFLQSSLVWKLDILPNSIDGEPIATTVSDLLLLFSNFPYDRLPKDSIIMGHIQHPTVVITILITYLISKPIIQYIVNILGITGTSKTFQLFVAFHNFILATFSFLVAINTWSFVLMHLSERGWEATYCDQDGSLWNSGFGAWHNVFYLSKYYELIDTLVLLMKRKKPSFLQMYHHTGIILIMWGTSITQGAWIQFMVLLNSIIHTMMYSYYLIKTLYPKYDVKIAKYLTMAQILQFLIGNTGTIGVQVMGSSCDTSASRFVLFLGQSYVYGLIFLFSVFAANRYRLKMKISSKGRPQQKKTNNKTM